MKDALGREITYMRISITDRCNLRCQYCMPQARPFIAHDDILRYEEILRICEAAVALGIRDFKVTGGEPLVRRGATDFIRSLKALNGVWRVSITTNGLKLEESLPNLVEAHLDGINISLDALDPQLYAQITGGGDVRTVLHALKASVETGIPTKVNTVLFRENESEWLPILALAEEHPLAVRFIEMMPIGCTGQEHLGTNADTLLEKATQRYPDLAASDTVIGVGPAAYYESSHLRGKVGIIAANSHKFCSSCNRVRLTSTGQLQLCLGQNDTVDLRTPIRQGCDQKEIEKLLAKGIYAKPVGHTFSEGKMAANKHMNEIGG